MSLVNNKALSKDIYVEIFEKQLIKIKTWTLPKRKTYWITIYPYSKSQNEHPLFTLPPVNPNNPTIPNKSW